MEAVRRRIRVPTPPPRDVELRLRSRAPSPVNNTSHSSGYNRLVEDVGDSRPSAPPLSENDISYYPALMPSAPPLSDNDLQQHGYLRLAEEEPRFSRSPPSVSKRAEYSATTFPVEFPDVPITKLGKKWTEATTFGQLYDIVEYTPKKELKKLRREDEAFDRLVHLARGGLVEIKKPEGNIALASLLNLEVPLEEGILIELSSKEPFKGTMLRGEARLLWYGDDCLVDRGLVLDCAQVEIALDPSQLISILTKVPTDIIPDY